MTQTSALTIRPAIAEDRAHVVRLLRGAGLPEDGLDEQFGPAYAVAVANGAIVGAEGMERYDTAGLLRSAVVAPDWRGKGIGEALTRDRLAWAASNGIREVWLLTTTAEAWFPRFGFQRADRAEAPASVQASREFAEACPASAIAMRRVQP
ncbi:MAG: GNAT family N-acetyltransferase [Gemmatimonadetes bacterium]|nr:GNAT family N-acetyltransferase [Gemmatimonadota bacterium]